MSRFLDRVHLRGLGLPMILAAAWLVAAPVFAQTPAPPARVPIEAFFDRPGFNGGKLSPDGRRLAFLVGNRDAHLRLAVLDLQTLKPTVVAGYSDTDVSHFSWVSDQRLVYDLAVRLTGPGRTDRGSGLFAVNADGSELRQLVETSRAFATTGEAQRTLPWNTRFLAPVGRRDSGDFFAIRPDSFDARNVGLFKLSRIETRRGRATEMDSPLNTTQFVLDRSGELRVAVTNKDNTRELLWRDAAGVWKSLEKTEVFGRRGFEPLALGPDGTLYGLADLGDKAALFTFDPATGQRADKPLLAVAGFDVRPELLFTHDKLLGVRTVVDAEVTQWLDPQMQALQEWADKRLPDTVNRLSVPYRAETPWVLLETFSDRQPAVSYALNSETRQLINLGQERSAIRPAQMGTMDFVRFKARDGLEIPAYLTVPAGEIKKNLPLVVLVHGGPYVRGATWGWNAEVQFLASRGHAVLQPEFRGSTGFGDKHFRAGWKQWGLGMQNDVADAVRWAIAQGIADPQRVCIAGASYGGYAALMGLVNDPELYRCAINWVGVTDIQMMFDVGWSDISDTWKAYGMPLLVGDPQADAAQFKATSPLQQAARIQRPLLMAYGAWDVRVPVVHGERLRDALKAHNKDVEWVVYPSEGHGWQDVKTQVDFWARVEKFLARHLQPRN